MQVSNTTAGSLFLVAAPSGAGKSTLVNALLLQEPAIKLSVSFTTRPPRSGEMDGREYHFTTVENFLARKAEGEFLESAEVHGNYYGTSRILIEQQMQLGTDILLEIDWQGTQQVKKRFPNAVGIFILPPSIPALEERLKKRGQDEPNVITRRILAAGGEMAHASEFEYVIINQEFALALSELNAIVKATRCRFAQQASRNAALFAQLGIHANPTI
ncbi:MAG: guanylate kinase [Undibacterium sp.]|uniref:guanylate kinase n=1 Tax=Undibacterium sp. TaxID=1914977 RepID=UPI00272122D7|nr:guanylate kinase [Undibacterium sp.]MDO8651578.1 guanylate kinase [Undibacterium sp.]